MWSDRSYVFRSALLALAIAASAAALVWFGTGSWNYGGGTFMVLLYAAAPVAAWLMDRTTDA